MLTFDEEFALAKRLDIDARGLKDTLRAESLAEFRRKRDQELKIGDIFYWKKIFEICVALSQSEKSKIGSRFEKLVFDCLDQASGAKVIRQWATPGFGRKPLDGYLPTGGFDFYFSVAHSTRERKEGTWNNEYEHIQQLRKKGGVQKPMRFICIANEAEEKAFGVLRGKLKNGIELISTHNRDAMRHLLSSIASADTL